MKKFIFLMIGALMLCQNSYATDYDFVAVSPSGHTLFYKIAGSNVWVVGPNGIQGDLIIPSQVTNNGTEYSVAYIAESAFSEVEANHGLTSVVIPNSVTAIYSRAFEDCRNLISVSLPSSLVSIYIYAFAGAGIDTLTIPSSVTSINEKAFQYCRNLSSITVDPGNTTYDSRNGCNALIKTSNNKLILGCSNTIIPNSVTQLGECAFNLCEGLQTIEIPSSILTIPNNIFDRCTNLRKVVVPSSIISIGSYAFYDCSSLDSLIMLSSTPPILEGTVFTTPVGVYVPCGSYQSYQDSWASSYCTFHEPESALQLFLSENNSMYGTAYFIQHHGSNVVCSDTTSEISAVANNGYHFSQWSDGNSNNPRIVQLTSDTAIVAIFEPNQYIVQGVAYDTTMGYVSGNDTANYLDTVTLTAVPKYGYSFVRWDDYTGYSWNPQYNTDNPRQVIATDNKSFTAFFTPNTYTLTVNVDTNIHGYCSGGGNYIYLSERTISATANYGYHFTHWSDGDTNNPRILTLTQDTSLYAIFQPNRYFVQGVPNDTAMGTVNGSDTADYLDTVTLTAVPNYGYQFSYWLYNGNNSWDVNNPLTAIATDEITYTAYFWPNVYSITVNADTSIHGSCTGGGSYTYLSERTISATANYGYHFTQWSDGDTNNPRTLTLTQDTQFVGMFAKNQYTVAGVTNDSIRGVVSGSAIVDYLDSVSFTATSNYGYHFQRWSDYNTDNPRTVIATDNISLTAYFYSNQYTIALSVDTSIHGTMSGAGSFYYLSERTITANANHGYHFIHWSDGDTNNPRTITLTQDTQFVAYFGKNTYTLTFQSDNPDLGIVNTASVNGEYLDSTMLIYTTPIAHYHFTQWNDGNTENPRRFVFDDNRTYTASFAIDVHTVGVQVDHLAHGTVSGAGSREYGQPITVSATPYSGYQFTHWSDGSTYNPYTFAVLEDKNLTAIFVADGEPWQDTVVLYDTAYVLLHDTTYLNVMVHDTTVVRDTTYIDVPYAVHDTTYITLTDTVTNTVYDTVTNTVYDTVDNYIYDTVTVTDTLWLTRTDTLWLHDTVTVHDTVYVTGEGIDDAEALNAKVYTSHGQVVVEGADGHDVALYDVNGRLLARKEESGERSVFDVTASGTYMIKIGHYPARKVVVVR